MDSISFSLLQRDHLLPVETAWLTDEHESIKIWESRKLPPFIDAQTVSKVRLSLDIIVPNMSDETIRTVRAKLLSFEFGDVL